MTLNEVKIQEALGVLEDSNDFYLELYYITDIEILKFIGINSSSCFLRRAVAINLCTPYSVLRYIYKNDPDNMTRQIAWRRVLDRWCRLFNQTKVPNHYRVRPFIHL